MVYSNVIKGNYVTMRAVDTEDADFIIRIRTSPHAVLYLHHTSDNLEEQRKWITNQRAKENDYYFTVLNSRGEKIGLVALYNINEKKAELGRWVSNGNALENLEMVYLLHDWGFNELGLQEIYSCTMKINKKVVSFWKKFGAIFDKEILTDYISIKNVVSRELFFNLIKPEIGKLLEKDRR